MNQGDGVPGPFLDSRKMWIPEGSVKQIMESESHKATDPL